jgi:photosystem II stability/assembly factor-like uncharacterized protein
MFVSMKNTILLILAILINATLFGQSIWQQLPNAPISQSRVDDVFFINRQTGWSADGRGKIHKTTNGGQTWTLQYESPDPFATYFRCIEFFNENIGYAGSLDKKFLRTTDGGATWTNISNTISPQPMGICGIHIVDSLIGYAAGQWDSPAFLLKTVDGGTTWTHQNMSTYANALVDVRFISRDTGFVSGKSNQGAVILYTTDGGQSWTQKFNSNISGEYVWKLQRVTPLVWVGSIQTFTSTGRMVKSTDGGQTWSTLPAPLPDMQGIGFATPEVGWIGGYGQGWYKTTNGGQSWAFEQFGGNFNRLFFLDSTFAYASGQSVYKFSDPTSAVEAPSVAQGFVALKWDFGLSPNPAKDQVHVTFTLDQDDNIRISLLDASGRELRELYRRRLSAGDHQIPLYIGNQPAGTYLVAIQRNWGLYTRRLVVE